MFLMKEIDLIHMLDPIQYEFRFFQNTLVDPEPGAGAETSIFRLRLQPKVSAPCGSGSTTLVFWIRQIRNVLNLPGPLLFLSDPGPDLPFYSAPLSNLL
jgi:hypothetical protein